MKFTLSTRDKKLLLMLGYVVSIALIGYFLILPQFDKKQEIADMQVVADDQLSQLKIKQRRIPSLEESVVTNRESFESSSTWMSPMMVSADVDKLVTGLVRKFGMMPLDLSISDNEKKVMLPYSRAGINPEDFSTALDHVLIFTVRASVRCEQTEWLKLLDELDNNYPYMRLVSFNKSVVNQQTMEGYENLTEFSFVVEIYCRLTEDVLDAGA